MYRPARKVVIITGLAAIGLAMITTQILSQPAPSDRRDPGVVLDEGTPTPTGTPPTTQAAPTPIHDAVGNGGPTTDVAQQPPAPIDNDIDNDDDDAEIED